MTRDDTTASGMVRLDTHAMTPPLDALPQAITLSDGTRITLREIQPDDADALKRGFAGLSPLSRYRRFLREVPEMTDAMAKYLTEVDGVTHVALVALATSPDLKHEDIVGVARAIRKPKPLLAHRHVAEVAVVVADSLQRRGLGRVLLDAIRHAALARGIEAFRAEVLASNEPVRQVLAQQGIEPVRADHELLLYEIPLSDEVHTGARESVFTRFLRVAASPLGHAIRSLR